MATFSELINRVVFDLHHGGFTKDADELQHLADLALDHTASSNSRNDVFKQIENRCHLKWLGDLYLPHLSQKDWWEKLERLGRLSKKHMEN